MSDPAQQPEQRLPGYELIEKIGSGGYGEVWSAIAPGGLRKAVKYVFGDQYDKRASNELHALEKVRAVRHPFLLSLERIEIVDGRLVVVSELADASLRDRYCECVRQGLAGIPRDELVGYLSDAADALDYLSREHDLAHLDIKPENLLLVAGHVKVADFGLVKSIGNNTNASLVGGMTPAYAAPEVFRGTPGRASDQYSLAILYQEMLTGAVPFAGANAAQLTLQHMNDDPDLSRLSESDRFVVARALAKSVDHRFETSSDFVAALRSTAAPAGGFAKSPAPAASFATTDQLAAPASSPRATAVFDDSAKPASGTMRLEPPPLAEPDPTEVESPTETDVTDFVAGPAVFLGIGGTGARVLRALRARMVERFGDEAGGPSLPMLLIDSDPQTLSAATRRGDAGVGLDAGETVCLPLRRPQEYRSKADELLRWLGRRWLYNVPRSLRTEGIRPLGRLALIDHARQTFQRVRSLVSQATDEASREASADATGLRFSRSGVRIYVVGSASGGVGSGMTTDFAYAVRSILGRLGVDDSTIIGVVTHSTPRDATRSELARVNAYAWLSEFEHFRSRSEGYPGDAGVGLPGHAPGVAAFDHTYFLPLGEKVDTPTFDSHAEAIADYLLADSVTPAGRVLDAAREATADDGPTLRSFAVRRREPGRVGTPTAEESAVVDRLLRRWLGEDAPSDTGADRTTDQVVHGSVAFLGQTQLDPATLASNCRALLEAALGGDATAFAEASFGELAEIGIEPLIQQIDGVFHVDRATDTPRAIDGKAIEDTTASLGERLVRDVSAWVFARLDDPQERCEGATRAVAWLLDHFAVIEADLDKLRAGIDADRVRWLGDARRGDAGPEAPTRLFQQRIDQAAIAAALVIVASLVTACERLREELSEQAATLAAIQDRFPLDESAVPAEASRYAAELDRRVQVDFLDTHGGLALQLATPGGADELGTTLAHLVRRVLGGTSAAADACVLDAGEFAGPPIAGAGGAYQRIALRVGASEDSESVSLVTEMSGASLPHLAASLIGSRRDYAAFAERVRTRRDIPWIDPVEQLTKPAEPSAPLMAEPLAAAAGPKPTAVLG